MLSTPVIAAIKQLHPGASLWVMTTPLAADLLKEDPLVAGVIPFDKRGESRGVIGLMKLAYVLRALEFDVVYSLHRSLRTAILLYLARIPIRIGFKEASCSFLYNQRVKRKQDGHEVLRNLSLLPIGVDQSPLEAYPLRLSCSERLPGELRLFLDSAKNNKFLVVVPGSAWRTKQWSADNYHQLCKVAVEQGLTVCILGAVDEVNVCKSVAGELELVNLAGKTDLSSFLAVIRDAALVVCNDSFALHVAAAFKTPTVAVFCATSPAFGFYPWQQRALVVEKQGLWCKPCRRHGSVKCPTGTESCMKDLSWREVWFNCVELLNRQTAS